MTILLLGCDGQIGWQLQRSLAPHGALCALARGDCDLADLDGLRSRVRSIAPGVIVNAAGYTAVDRAESEADSARRINAEAPALLAAECARSGALLIHYSTDYIFDGGKPGPYREDDPARPLNVYGRTKHEGELAISGSGARALIFRTSGVFGARGDNFVKRILRLARERDFLEVVADQVGSPTPAALVSTVTGLALAAVRRGGLLAVGEARLYHLAAAHPLSWYEFARTIVGLAARRGFALRMDADAVRPILTGELAQAARRPLNSRLYCSRLESALGLAMPDWQPYLERVLQLLALKQNGY
ncbi:MAG TPA: dTDP-4-dehydrorhamnose reductase [Rhodocyclaceae bacterium]|nr:dTDP-4-dehydrorhamnose reductase [Rhodocyclaceae bacterium]